MFQQVEIYIDARSSETTGMCKDFMFLRLKVSCTHLRRLKHRHRCATVFSLTSLALYSFLV